MPNAQSVQMKGAMAGAKILQDTTKNEMKPE